MNAFTASEPGAQDFLALTRLGGDPATMIAAVPAVAHQDPAAPYRADQRGQITHHAAAADHAPNLPPPLASW